MMKSLGFDVKQLDSTLGCATSNTGLWLLSASQLHLSSLHVLAKKCEAEEKRRTGSERMPSSGKGLVNMSSTDKY